MRKIKYSKTKRIKNKVFCCDDILLLANIVQEQFGENDLRQEFSVVFDDESRIQSSDISVFSTDAFKRKQCKSVHMEYLSRHCEKSCCIDLYNAALMYLESEADVASSDLVWYESMQKRLEDVLDDVQDQNKLVRHPFAITAMLSVLEMLLLLVTLASIFPPQHIELHMFALSILGTTILMGINLMLVDNLRKACPSIEFAFGPAHRSTSYKRKRIIGVLIPFIIDAAFFVFGLLIG